MVDISEGLEASRRNVARFESHKRCGSRSVCNYNVDLSLRPAKSTSGAISSRLRCDWRSNNLLDMDFFMKSQALGTIKNARMELEAGLIVRLRATVAGEVLAELLRLAKEILAEQTDAAKNVGAVLVAAGYEDLLRRMGRSLRVWPVGQPC